MLEEGVSDHCQECVTVKALPGSSFEVIKTEFFFQLLVSLLANPSRLDGGRQGVQVGLHREIGEIVFLLPRRSVFADEPSLVPWRMLVTLVPDALRWSVGYPHADSSEAGLELSFRAGAPTDVLPLGVGQHVFGRLRKKVGNVPLAAAPALGNRPRELDPRRVHLEVPRNTDRPSQLASCQPLAECRP